MTRILRLPFSVENVYGRGYYNVALDGVEHFDSFLLVRPAQTLPSEIVNLRSTLTSVFSGDRESGSYHVFYFLRRGATLFGTLSRVRVDLDRHTQGLDSHQLSMFSIRLCVDFRRAGSAAPRHRLPTP